MSDTKWEYNRACPEAHLMQDAGEAKKETPMIDTTKADSWQRTVQDIFNEMHFSQKGMSEDQILLAVTILEMIEKRHSGFFCADVDLDGNPIAAMAEDTDPKSDDLEASENDNAALAAEEARFAPGSYGCHEALHMTSMLAETVGERLSAHPAIMQNPDWLALASRAEDTLHALYQAIGQLHMT